VPATNHSRTGVWQAGPALTPAGAQTVARTRPAGGAGQVAVTLWRASSMVACQIGPAPSTPETLAIGRLSALPTQTPTARSGVAPSVQLSRKPVVVPVLTAAFTGNVSEALGPKPGSRASASARMSERT